jgi:hypothetical protein
MKILVSKLVEETKYNQSILSLATTKIEKEDEIVNQLFLRKFLFLYSEHQVEMLWKNSVLLSCHLGFVHCCGRQFINMSRTLLQHFL